MCLEKLQLVHGKLQLQLSWCEKVLYHLGISEKFSLSFFAFLFIAYYALHHKKSTKHVPKADWARAYAKLSVILFFTKGRVGHLELLFTFCWLQFMSCHKDLFISQKSNYKILLPFWQRFKSKILVHHSKKNSLLKKFATWLKVLYIGAPWTISFSIWIMSFLFLNDYWFCQFI